jgi:hypothetical protein
MVSLHPPLLWASESNYLHDQLAERGVLDPETGERFTVRRVDDAIQLAVETVNGREGTRIVDIFDATWRMLRADVESALGLEAGALDEVTP